MTGQGGALKIVMSSRRRPGTAEGEFSILKPPPATRGNVIKIKRVYDPPTKNDSFRILVDRLWPRGLTKDKAKIDLWLKEIAPSSTLRKGFCHEPGKWAEFKKRYETELKDKKPVLDQLRVLEKRHGLVTLVYGAKEERFNNAVALQEILDGHKLA